MIIEGIVISCYVNDVHLTRICVASIRFWYPQLAIWLLKDRQYGDFDTSEIERHWNVQVYPGRESKLGWGFGKLEVMTELPARRLLIIDSDVVFAGRVIDLLETFDEDLVVDKADCDEAGIEEQLFDVAGLGRLDPQFYFPGYGFNTGQIVATTGRLGKGDFAGLIDWQRRTAVHPEIFKMGEQGLANYVILNSVQRGKLSIRREPFMVWPGIDALTEHIQVRDFTAQGPHTQLIHWAGLRWGKTVEEMPRPEILLHFEEMYYRRVSFGTFRRQWRRVAFRVERAYINPLKDIVKQVFPMFRPPQPAGHPPDASHLYSLLAKGRWRGWLWPRVVDLWIGLALFLFLIMRVLESNTAKHVFRSLRVR